MKQIFKYKLEVCGEQIIDIPRLNTVTTFKDQILKVDTQYNIPYIWVLVDDEMDVVKRKIQTFGTGHCCDDIYLSDYLGSYQLMNGDFVGHLFGY